MISCETTSGPMDGHSTAHRTTSKPTSPVFSPPAMSAMARSSAAHRPWAKAQWRSCSCTGIWPAADHVRLDDRASKAAAGVDLGRLQREVGRLGPTGGAQAGGQGTRGQRGEHFDLDPDLLCVAKAMSGGLAPIGAVIATAPVAKSMEENEATFYSTYGWHPRSVAAAITTLRGLKANRRRLLADVAEMSEYFRVRLLQLEFDRPAAVRLQGLAIGLDVG